MGFLWPFENHVQHNANVAAFLELVNGEDSDDDDDEEEDLKVTLWRYVLVATQVDDMEWECSICKEGEKVEVVWHPSNCHTFHSQ